MQFRHTTQSIRYEPGLSKGISFPVIPEAHSQSSLQRGVLFRDFRMTSQVVSKLQMILQSLAPADYQVKMMREPISWTSKCFPARDAGIPPMQVAIGGEPANAFAHIQNGSSHDVDVNDRLRSKTSYRRAAHMFDCYRNLSNC